MSYTPLFVQKSTVVDYLNKNNITVSTITDIELRSAERRLQRRIRDRGWDILGIKITYNDLLGCSSEFSDDLEEASMFAVVAELNSIGKDSSPAGPVTSASGDGLSIGHGYLSGKKVNPDFLATAEEKLLNIVDSMLREYQASCGSARNRGTVKNENYDVDFYRDDLDRRMVEGNDEFL